MNLPSITTPRLRLRPLRRKDANAIYAWAKNPAVGPPAGWLPHASLDDAHDFLDFVEDKQKRGQPGPWAIMHKADRRLIGTIEFHGFHEHKAEIGFALDEAYWNQGIMTEAARAAIVIGIERFDLKRIAYKHFPDNEPSRALRKKLGFTEEGLLRKAFKHADGRLLDEVVASYTDDDYARDYHDVYAPFKQSIVIDD